MRESVSRRLALVGSILLAAVLLSGCIVGTDDDDPTPTSESRETPTEAASPSPQVTATATTQPSPEAPTATTAPATATTTPTPRPTSTATPIPTEPLGEIAPINPIALENFTLSTDISLRGIPGQSDFVLNLLILQASPSHYYVKSTTGGSSLESWLVDGTTYLTQADGSVAELPGGSDTALFSPALLVQTVPALAGETQAIDLGTEEVAGRQTTHRQIAADDLIADTTWLPADASDADGVVDLWIDNELGIVIRQEADITWENADGSTGSYEIRYEVTNVGATEPVTAPGT